MNLLGNKNAKAQRALISIAPGASRGTIKSIILTNPKGLNIIQPSFIKAKPYQHIISHSTPKGLVTGSSLSSAGATSGYAYLSPSG